MEKNGDVTDLLASVERRPFGLLLEEPESLDHVAFVQSESVINLSIARSKKADRMSGVR